MPAALIVGASRTIGVGLVGELAEASDRRIWVEQLEITDDEGIERLRGRCATASLHLLLINAGIADPDEPVGSVSPALFTQVMIANARRRCRPSRSGAPASSRARRSA